MMNFATNIIFAAIHNQLQYKIIRQRQHWLAVKALGS